MKKYLIIVSVFVMTALFTSCGQTVGTDSDVSSGFSESTTSSAKETTTVATTITTSTTTVKSAKAFSDNPPDTAYFTTIDNIEVYNEITVADLIADTNTEIIYSETPVDTSETGEKQTEIVFEYEGGTYRKNISYTVVDTTEPLVLNSGWNPYTKVGEPFDINSIIGFVDNYDRSPTVTYTGNVDNTIVGSYPITVTVADNSGNSTSWDMTVFTVNEIPTPEDNNPRVEFSDFMEYYNYENVSYGIDVSAWQTNVDYEAVKDEGVEFVIIRMGYCYSDIYMDDYYYANIENAENVGLDIGIYFYSTANTEEKAREQAQWIVSQLDGRELDFPVAFDWEEWGSFQKYGMNIHDLNEVFYAFCDELEKSGYSGMLYSSKNFLDNFWENKINRPVWLAHYVDETNYTGAFSIWQASAYGRINGISGDVDMNIRINDMPLD